MLYAQAEFMFHDSVKSTDPFVNRRPLLADSWKLDHEGSRVQLVTGDGSLSVHVLWFSATSSCYISSHSSHLVRTWRVYCTGAGRLDQLSGPLLDMWRVMWQFRRNTFKAWCIQWASTVCAHLLHWPIFSLRLLALELWSRNNAHWLSNTLLWKSRLVNVIHSD